MNHIPEGAKHAVDGLSVGAMLGSIVSILPEVAAIFTIIWTGIRIYETETVRKLRKKDKKEVEE